MATSRCVGFALPVQTGWRRKTELQVRRTSEKVVLKLGLGPHGSCACRAAANKYDSGYKKSASKRTDSKKSDKYGSVAEASSSGRQTKKVSKKDQVGHFVRFYSVSILNLHMSFARFLQFSPSFCGLAISCKAGVRMK